MKICFTTDSYPPNIGGAEIAIQKIAEGVYKNGIDVIIITTKAREDFSFQSQIPDSKIFRIRTPKFLQRFWFLIFSFPVIFLKCKDADILHGTSYGGVLQTFIVSKFLRKPSVVTIHEFMGSRWNQFSSNFFSAIMFRVAEKFFAGLNFSKFITVSEYSQKTLLEAGVCKDKITVIYNGESDIEKFILKSNSEIRKELNIPEGRFIFAAYGRTGLTKGFEFLVDAIPDVIKELNDSVFVLILSSGNKRLWKKITSKIKKMDSEKVFFFSSMERKNLLRYLNATDAIIIPSLSEGFGFTTLEACLLKKIVIASNTGSIPEVISGNHILVEPGSPEAIVKGCIQAYNGIYTSSEEKKFNWENSVNNYIKVYQEFLN